MLVIPLSIRDRVFEFPDQLIVEIDDRKANIVFHRGNSDVILDKRSINLDDALEKADALNWLNQLRHNHMECTVLLPAEKILVKTLTLPATSETNMQEILGFEMDRQTPFNQDQVYYDARILSRNQESEKISLNMFVVTRNYLETVLSDLKSWSLKIKTVSFKTSDKVEDINLMPVNARESSTFDIDALTIAAGTCVLILFIAALYLPLIHKNNILESLKSEVDETRLLAMQVQPLITEKENLLSRTRFLSQKKQNSVPIIEILNELTTLLPDDTYLDRLIIRENEIQVYGESDTATSILKLIENSDYFENAQSRSPVTKNNITNKEKFHFSAKLVTGESA